MGLQMSQLIAQGEKVSLQSKLREADLAADDKITLTYSAGADVVHAYDDYMDSVLEQTGFADTVATVITTSEFPNEAISEMRQGDFLEDYERDFSGFESFVSKVLSENMYEFGFVDHTVEQYDYKRGFLTLEANVETTVGSVMESPEYLFAGWSTTVPTKIGQLKIDG